MQGMGSERANATDFFKRESNMRKVYTVLAPSVLLCGARVRAFISLISIYRCDALL